MLIQARILGFPIRKNDQVAELEGFTRNGNLTRIADLTTPIPNATGNFQKFDFGAIPVGVTDILPIGANSALSGGQLVFGGHGSGGQRGLYYSDSAGVLQRIIDRTTPISGAGLATIDGDAVGFVGNEPSGVGVYRYSVSAKSFTPIVPAGNQFPNRVQPTAEIAPSISENAVAFNVEASSGDYRGIYYADSTGVHFVADGTTAAPGGGGTFVTGPVGMGSNGVSISGKSVAFSSPPSQGGAGVYTTLGGSLSKVISTSDTLFGRAIKSIVPASPKISDGNILFGASFEGGATGLYVAIGEHHWDAAGGGAWDSAVNWSFEFLPRHVVPAYLDPANGGTITGPVQPVALKSLTVGATQSGIARLLMQSHSEIRVTEKFTNTSRGYIDLAGTILTIGGVDNSGVIIGAGGITGGLTNRETGEFRVRSGGVHISGPGPDGTGVSSNAGLIEVANGTLQFTGPLVNAASTGLITARDATLRFSQLSNAGSLAIVAGTTDVHGDVFNTGSIVISGGTGGGMQTAIFYDDVVQNGTLTVSASGTTHSVAVFLGGFDGAGGITGGGDVFFEGDLRPGNSPASVTYAANVSLGSTSQLTLELGGRIVGADYDHISVTGSFALGGSLSIELIGGFSPRAGDQFDLFDFNPALSSGAFSSIQLPALGPGLSWDNSHLNQTGIIAVVPEPSTAFLVGLSSILLVGGLRRRKLQN